MATYTGTIPSGVLAVGAGLPAAWTQQVGLSLTALESPWTAYTPALGGWTLGNGTIAGHYFQVGKLVGVTAKLILGSTTTIAGVLGIGLPFTASTTLQQVGTGLLNQAGTAIWHCGVSISATTADVRSLGTNGVLNTMTSTVPFTWAATHSVSIQAVYETI